MLESLIQQPRVVCWRSATAHLFFRSAEETVRQRRGRRSSPLDLFREKKEIQCPIPSPGEPCQLFCPSCRRPLIIQRRLTREEWSQTSKQRSPPSPTAPLALPFPQPIGSVCSTAPLSSPTHSQPTGSASSTSPPPPLSLPAPPPQEQHKGTIKVTWHNSGYIVQDVFFGKHSYLIILI